MNILPSCKSCGNSFTTRRSLQKHCPTCIEKSHTCIDCGAQKHRSVRGPRCRKCTNITRIGKPNLKGRCQEKPIGQVIAESEALGTLPEKQYALGYVIGVIFGDGSISKDVHDSLKRSDGALRDRPVTLYRIRLQVTERIFAERFARQWQILTGKTPTIMTSVRTNFSKSTVKIREGYAVRLFTIGPRHALLGRYLAHLKHDSELYELLRFPPLVMQGIIHGMIDSEGWSPDWNSRKRIEISNKRATLLDVLAHMLNLLGYKATVYTSAIDQMSRLVTYMDYQKYIGSTN